MDRRAFLSRLTLGALAAPLTVEAQQGGKVVAFPFGRNAELLASLS